MLTLRLLFASQAGVVEEACLLDFQLSRYAPPVLDLLYLVYSCTDRDMRDRHLDALMREYHDELSSALRRLGSDPEQVYPWQAMQVGTVPGYVQLNSSPFWRPFQSRTRLFWGHICDRLISF